MVFFALVALFLNIIEATKDSNDICMTNTEDRNDVVFDTTKNSGDICMTNTENTNNITSEVNTECFDYPTIDLTSPLTDNNTIDIQDCDMQQSSLSVDHSAILSAFYEKLAEEMIKTTPTTRKVCVDIEFCNVQRFQMALWYSLCRYYTLKRNLESRKNYYFNYDYKFMQRLKDEEHKMFKDNMTTISSWRLKVNNCCNVIRCIKNAYKEIEPLRRRKDVFIVFLQLNEMLTDYIYLYELHSANKSVSPCQFINYNLFYKDKIETLLAEIPMESLINYVCIAANVYAQESKGSAPVKCYDGLMHLQNTWKNVIKDLNYVCCALDICNIITSKVFLADEEMNIVDLTE